MPLLVTPMFLGLGHTCTETNMQLLLGEPYSFWSNRGLELSGPSSEGSPN
jgi:hypothetical protein